MSSNRSDGSQACKDAYDVLKGAVEIKYANTEVWRLETDDREHPVVPALRAAAMDAVVSDPGQDAGVGISDLQSNLVEERKANVKFRDFLGRVQSLCELGGFEGSGSEEMLTWMRTKFV
jgi:hypothetical protein